MSRKRGTTLRGVGHSLAMMVRVETTNREKQLTSYEHDKHHEHLVEQTHAAMVLRGCWAQHIKVVGA